MAPDWLVSLQREDGFQAASLGFAQDYVDMSMRLRLAVKAAGRRGSVYRGGDGRMQMLDTAWAPSRGVLWCSNERPRADCRGCRKVQALTGSPPNQPLGLVPRPPATRRHPRRYHQNIAWETSAASNRARRGSSALSTRLQPHVTCHGMLVGQHSVRQSLAVQLLAPLSHCTTFGSTTGDRNSWNGFEHVHLNPSACRPWMDPASPTCNICNLTARNMECALSVDGVSLFNDLMWIINVVRRIEFVALCDAHRKIEDFTVRHDPD
jgi:hypothetical protein